VAVVDGTTLEMGPPTMAASVGAMAWRVASCPAEAVEHQQHDLGRLDRGGREPRRQVVAGLEQRGHHVADACSP